MKYRVTGPLEVAGASKGQVVDLDPARTNIDALITAGHVAPVPPAKPRRKGE